MNAEGPVAKWQRLRGTGRWIVEMWVGTGADDEDVWEATIYRGCPLDFAMEITADLTKRPASSYGCDGVLRKQGPFRCRDVDTNDIIMGTIL